MRQHEPQTPFGFDTLAVRAGQSRTHEGEHNDPIFLTSSFVFDSAQQAADRFAETEPGNIYSRFTNPTVRAFERRLAALEGGDHGFGTASGMSAILTLALAVLSAGDHVVVSRNVFGSTISLFSNIMERFGVRVTYVDVTDIGQWEQALTTDTRLLFLETPTNPLGEVADIARLAELAHRNGSRLVVDNVTCTPALQQPLRLGADVVVHSATKYIDGHGRCVGGAIVTSDQEVADAVFKVLRTAGPSLSPFSAWVFLKSLETLRLRMLAHSASALALAGWLEREPGVRRVHYPGLPGHPQHALATRQQRAYGGIVSFEVEGGRERAWRVVDQVQLISVTANLGDAKSTITHPASTTHSRISAEERAAAGVTEGLLRVSVGLEEIEDIQADLHRGLGVF